MHPPPSPAASLESPGHVGGCFAEQPFFNLRSCTVCSCEAEVSGLESTLVSGDDNPQPAANTDFSFVSFLQHERLSRLESGGSDTSTERASARARREAREARLATLSSRAEDGSGRDYRKLYESALTENQKLKTKLQEAQLELADVKSKLEKMAQKQDKIPDRSSALETEKRERRALERKMSEMEEEMKVLTELKSDNQRLKDENGALIRVISKLSK
nr:protein phosphatase 1 regulatory subunit 12B-like isoform X2 [Odocoileus virginianus texanus]